MHRLISYILATLILLVLSFISPGLIPAAGAPAHNGSNDETVTLRLWGGDWGIPPKDATDPRRRAQRAVFERFRELYPEIKITGASGTAFHWIDLRWQAHKDIGGWKSKRGTSCPGPATASETQAAARRELSGARVTG